jgi:hypothetical protein
MRYLLILGLLACGENGQHTDVDNKLIVKSNFTQQGNDISDFKVEEFAKLLDEYKETNDLKEFMIQSIKYLDIVNHLYIADKTFLQFLLEEIQTSYDDFNKTIFLQMVRDDRLLIVDEATKYNFFMQLNHLLADSDRNGLARELASIIVSSGKINDDELSKRVGRRYGGKWDWSAEFIELVDRSRFLTAEDAWIFLNSVQLLYTELLALSVAVDTGLHAQLVAKELKHGGELPNALDILCWDRFKFGNNYHPLYKRLVAYGITPSTNTRMILRGGRRGELFSCKGLVRRNRRRRLPLSEDRFLPGP